MCSKKLRTTGLLAKSPMDLNWILVSKLNQVHSTNKIHLQITSVKIQNQNVEHQFLLGFGSNSNPFTPLEIEFGFGIKPEISIGFEYEFCINILI